jgi:putative transcriptional regulator
MLDLCHKGGLAMSVSYKRLQHLMIEKDVSNAELMRRANISANIIAKIKNGQYIALDKVESICLAMNCTPNDMMEFTPTKAEDGGTING